MPPTNTTTPSIHLRGQALGSIFELVGHDENALTSALGWCLAKVPPLLAELAGTLSPGQQVQGAKIILQEHSGKHGITDIELRVPGQLAWIIEAKVGHAPPSAGQLARYAAKLNGEAEPGTAKLLVVLAKSDRRDLWLQHNVPPQVLGVPVAVVSWGQVRAAIDRSYPPADHTGKSLLRQLRDFIEVVLVMRTVNSNRTYVISVNWKTFGGTTTFVEVIEKFGRYFHPIGPGWPSEPPNYIAFRWSGRLQSVHHVDHYEIITDFHPHFPDVPAAPIDPHYLYRLGPPIRPAQEVRTGNIFRNGRVWAHLDLLLTSATVAEARDLTKVREQAAMP